jgi:hypothetical protein
MTVAIFPAIAAGGMVLSSMAKAIQALYGMAVDVNEYLDQHIKDMTGSDNPTISRTGRILEMAKLGFGIGYITPVAIIAVGQLLLGNPLTAISTVATAATFTNPIAMTCAAIGAIYYGWGALSETEREETLEKLSSGLEIGTELIKSMVNFIINKTKELLSSKNIEEITKYIESAAALFGKSLGDVTHKLSDVVSDTFDVFKKKSGVAMKKTFEAATEACSAVGSGVDMLKDKVGDAAVKTQSLASEAIQAVSSTVSRTTENTQIRTEKTSQKANDVSKTAETDSVRHIPK